MFGATLVFAVTLMHAYVFWRAASVPSIRRRIPRRLLIGLGLGLWVAFVAFRSIGAGAGGHLAMVSEFLAMTWLAVLFLAAIALLAVDLVTGFGFLLRRFVPALRGAALVAGALLSAFALVQGLRAPVVQDYEVRVAGLPAELEGTVIVALSDLHLGALLGEDWLAARVAQVEAERPDVVVLLGDVFEGHTPPGPELLAVLRRLSAPLGVWAVLGNHEFHSAETNNSAVFARAGIHLLRNAWAEPRPGLVLAGVDSLAPLGGPGQAADALAKALAGRPAGATVLLSHTPLPPEQIAGKGIDLMLSGHTHGGQLWPFGYLVRQRFPLFEGRYELAGTTAIVCRGTGTWGPRMRLWHPGEILRVTLHRATSG